MKVLSLLLTAALLVLADKLATDLKQAGALPALKAEQPMRQPHRPAWPNADKQLNADLIYR
jgi:hypothetical protein